LPATLWIDVEDLFDHAAGASRPSGIQRLGFEVCRALWEGHGAEGRIGFLRHDPPRAGFRAVPWTEVLGAFTRLARAPADPRRVARHGAGDAPAGGESAGRWRLRRLIHRLPPDIRRTLLAAARAQAAAWAAQAALLRACAHTLATAARARPQAGAGGTGPTDFATRARPGDVLVVLGAAWRYPDHAGLVGAARQRHGLRVALLVFDVIPLRRPEWFEPALTRDFRAWFAATLKLADTVFAISRATAADIARVAGELGIPGHAGAEVLPIGGGFAVPAGEARHRDAPEGEYALFVSTIEARKNHQLLVQVWRRLLDEMPPARVPGLVFAGRVGWLVGDLMAQLANTGGLGGKIRVIADATDAELAGLYRGCRFTLFPSLYEGWGLPVTESLRFGKPCLAARASALPEAGGGFARYFDPENVNDAHAAIRAAIDDPAGLRAWEAEIARGFTPVPWTATAEAILRRLDAGSQWMAPSGS
jgi:glycosyltransferase involved in cell wall biosynthesis